MSARQRTLLILALSAIWPAWAVIRTFIWHPALANEIGDVCAVATAALAAAVALYPQKLPTLRDWRRWKADSVLRAHFSALRDEVGTLNARLCHHEDETAGRLDRLDARIADLFSVMDATARAAGGNHPDLEKTMPMLRLVEGQQEAG